MKTKGNDIKNIKNRLELLFLLFIMIKEKRKWWLLPLLFLLAILSIFINISGNNPILPAIYTFF